MTDYNQAINDFFNANLAVGIAIIVLCLLIAVLSIIALWKVFTKAGERGWKAIIPIYNFYILCKIVWSTKAFWQMLALTVLGAVCEAVASVFVKESAGNIVFLVLTLICSVAMFIYGIVLYLKLSQAFGHGVGYAIGLIFLSTIFLWILGFGSSQYVGNTTVSKSNKTSK